MAQHDGRGIDDAADAAARWLAAFDDALQRRDSFAAAELFLPESHWRDILAFTWHLETMDGVAEIRAALSETVANTQPKGFRIDPKRTPPRWVTRAGTEAIEALFSFETAVGRGSGVLRLVPDPRAPEHLCAWTLSTTLDELTGFEERIGARRPAGPSDLRDFGAENWSDQRRKAAAYADRDPAVIVIGGGQAGLAIAARLGQLGVDTLIVERKPRIGDNWRNRYHSLTLHNEVFVNHLPYMPFPPNWPIYIAKDKLANWLEAYVEAMELNCWTGAEFIGGAYDDRAERWTVEFQRSDGTRRTMRPRHVVFAVGASPIAHIPELPSLAAFAGTLMHSENYVTGAPWRGRKALVLGTGTSGHDVAQDLHAAGAEVTLIQRSPTYVVSLKEAQKVYAIYSEGIPFEDCDLLATSMPFPVLLRSYQLSTLEMKHHDEKLLQGLAAAGFHLDFQPGDAGFQMRYLQRGGGYYFNVGCSDLIIKGEVGLMQYSDIECFVPEGARLRDNSIVPADLLVLATGYKSQQEVARRLLGDEVAERIGPVWGFDQRGELRNMWKRTAHKGLWFTAGSLAQCRIYSKYLALQIKACEEGLMPLELPVPKAKRKLPAGTEAL
ncbi:MAG: NAD(P)/FAD-dependent oxidoreductase [Pseudomonadota bacterium]|nr:NAD(P)/FAD-dependent oxidoreductase [Pseudomonadota bacterium]